MCGQTATASSFKYPQLILRQNSRSLGISTYAPLYRCFNFGGLILSKFTAYGDSAQYLTLRKI